jgi:3-hydroxyisobutyrate dehydrogenase-like beta-hydroxyacid dehydrogenase
MARLAFCGLGLAGSRMAARLRAAGHDLAAWIAPPRRSSRSPTSAPGRSPRLLAPPPGRRPSSRCSPTPALDEVVFGPRGLAEGLDAGATLIDMSTVGPDAIRQLAERLGQSHPGRRGLGAPVLGSIAQTEGGSLKMFVGGSGEAFTR